MNRANRILLLLLAAQVVVLAGTRLISGRGRGPAKVHKLFEGRIDPKAVTRVSIAAADGKTIVLERRGNDWVLASAGSYPALANKVSDLLSKWPELRAGAPVTDKPAHQRALEVHPESFQRRITFAQAGKPDLVVVMGNSAGLKDVHVRLADEARVYLVKDLSSYDAGTTPGDWVPTEYFKVDRDKVVSLTLRNAEGELKLKRGADKKWALEEAADESPKLKESEVDALLSSATSVALQEPVGDRLEPRFGLDKPAATLTLVTDPKEKSPYVLQIGAKEGDAYYAKSSTSRFVVRLGAWAAETFTKKKLADLEEKKKDEKKDEGNTKDEAPPPGMPPGMPPAE